MPKRAGGEIRVLFVSIGPEIQGGSPFGIALYAVDQRPDEVLVFIPRLGRSIEYGHLPDGAMFALVAKWFPIGSVSVWVKSERERYRFGDILFFTARPDFQGR